MISWEICSSQSLNSTACGKSIPLFDRSFWSSMFRTTPLVPSVSCLEASSVVQNGHICWRHSRDSRQLSLTDIRESKFWRAHSSNQVNEAPALFCLCVYWWQTLVRVARLAFLTPNFTCLAFCRGSWRQKNWLAFCLFFLQYLALLEAVRAYYQTGVLGFKIPCRKVLLGFFIQCSVYFLKRYLANHISWTQDSFYMLPCPSS